MEKTKHNSLKHLFHRFSTWVSNATGKPAAFLIALASVIIWAGSGKLFNFSEEWQIFINTGTTIVTFLMIFVIQQSQNRDTTAIHLKLNELIAANKDTSNRLVASEDMTQDELEVIKKFYKKLSSNFDSVESVFSTHSLDEAERKTESKLQRQSIKHPDTASKPKKP